MDGLGREKRCALFVGCLEAVSVCGGNFSIRLLSLIFIIQVFQSKTFCPKRLSEFRRDFNSTVESSANSKAKLNKMLLKM